MNPTPRILSLAAALALAAACGPMHGTKYTPHDPETPALFPHQSAVELAELPDSTLCVRLDDQSVQCGLLDTSNAQGMPAGAGPFATVPLLGTNTLSGFMNAPLRDWDAGAEAICGQSAEGLSCAFLTDEGGGPTEVSGEIEPTPLSAATSAQQVGLAVCASGPGAPESCAWDPADIPALAGPFPPVCVLSADQTVKCWPVPNVLPDAGPGLVVASLDPSEAQTVPGLELAAQLSTSPRSDSSCVVTPDGHVQCWGTLGADGGVSTVQDAKNGQALSGAVQVAAAGDHACALISDGSVECWGSSGLFAPSFASASAVQVPKIQHALTVVVSDFGVRSGIADEDCALQADGKVLCWGGYDTQHGWADQQFCPCGPGI